jgi:hypothetical protein
LAWTHPNPVFISSRAKARNDQSFTITMSAMWAAACDGETPMGTASVTTPNSPSKSMSSLSRGSGTSS